VNELAVTESSKDDGISASWDGTNFEGKYVGSGVYFFTGVDSHGRSFKDKMVVIRR